MHWRHGLGLIFLPHGMIFLDDQPCRRHWVERWHLPQVLPPSHPISTHVAPVWTLLCPAHAIADTWSSAGFRSRRHPDIVHCLGSEVLLSTQTLGSVYQPKGQQLGLTGSTGQVGKN